MAPRTSASNSRPGRNNASKACFTSRASSTRTRSEMNPRLLDYLAPIALLIGSNVFMTIAWYGHLKFTSRPLWLVVVVSWGIAFFEYCLQVPGNRIGYRVYNPAQLKTIQEIITLVVFAVFSVSYLGASLRWNHVVGFALIVFAAFFIFYE